MIKKTVSLAAGALMLLATALPALAAEDSLSVGADVDISTSGGVHAKADATVGTTLVDRAKSRADEEVNRRIDALKKLEARINGMQRLSGDEKNSISATIAAQITAMTDLQGKIDNDANEDATSSLKEDIKSITGSYRIFALVIPQGAITAASDRVMTIVGTMNNLSTQFQARITAAGAAGNDVTAETTALADMNAKVSDAGTQAQAAVTEVSSLTPDNGDQTKLKANLTALKDARAKIVAAQKDLITARMDARVIVKGLGSFKTSASATTGSGDN